MSNRLIIAGLTAMSFVTMGLGAGAYAETSAPAFLKAVNGNHDKTLSKEEVDAYAKKTFARIETDQDKTLDQKELKGRLTAAGLSRADSDKDKTVDEAEFVAYADKLFDEANHNNDKTLSVKELKTPAGKKLIKLLD